MPGFDVDEFLDGYQVPTAAVKVCGRGDLVVVKEALEAKVLDQGPSDTLYDAELAGLARDIRDIEAQMEAATHEFTFRALPTRDWQDLIRKHAPTKAQTTKHGPALDHNPDSFPVAAVAACAVEPELTEPQAQRIHDTVHLGDWDRLWTTVRHLNTEAATNPKSVAAALIDRALASAASSTTAAPEASPAASS